MGELFYDKSEPVENIITWVYEQGSFTPIAKLIDGERFSIVSDYLGTPIQAYDSEGELVWERELTIYGSVRKETGTANFVPMRYQGQYFDQETELCYNRFRYYDSISGNYISQDPIRLDGGMILYGYVKDTNAWVDVFGLESCWDDAITKASADPNKVHHILQSHHEWQRVVDDPGDWSKISVILKKVLEEGVEAPYKKVRMRSLAINGETVEVIYIKLSNGDVRISDAWVKTVS